MRNSFSATTDPYQCIQSSPNHWIGWCTADFISTFYKIILSIKSNLDFRLLQHMQHFFDFCRRKQFFFCFTSGSFYFRVSFRVYQEFSVQNEAWVKISYLPFIITRFLRWSTVKKMFSKYFLFVYYLLDYSPINQTYFHTCVKRSLDRSLKSDRFGQVVLCKTPVRDYFWWF